MQSVCELERPLADTKKGQSGEAKKSQKEQKLLTPDLALLASRTGGSKCFFVAIVQTTYLWYLVRETQANETQRHLGNMYVGRPL